MNILIHPTYFPSISHYVAMLKADSVTFEMEDNFQKQTNRNRMYIYSPNGVQMLNIPIKHSKEKHQKYKDVRIENDFGWQKNHFKSLEAAYRTSPFFEYFEDDFRPLFEKRHEFLMDLNLEIFELVNNTLGIKIIPEKTTEFFHDVPNFIDLRHLANGKKDTTQLEIYTQVFNDKHGFINNLSILDLLFNEGRYAVDYLKRHLACIATLNVIEKRMEQSEALIFVVSDNSMKSVWCKYELNYFLELNKPMYIIMKSDIEQEKFSIEKLTDKWFIDPNYKKLALLESTKIKINT